MPSPIQKRSISFPAPMKNRFAWEAAVVDRDLITLKQTINPKNTVVSASAKLSTFPSVEEAKSALAAQASAVRAENPEAAEPLDHEIKDYERGEVRVRLRSGEKTNEEILRRMRMEYPEAELAYWYELERMRVDEATWKPVTDGDRLDAAFAALNKKKIVALHSATETQSGGWERVTPYFEADASYLGAVFYTEQGVERALDHGVLAFYWGARREDASPDVLQGVAKIIVAELKAAGLEVDWSGEADGAIVVDPIHWSRRRTSRARKS